MLKDLLNLLSEIILGWFAYKHRGHVRPDHPDEKNYPIITGPADALAQRQIDRATKPKDRKK